MKIEMRKREEIIGACTISDLSNMRVLEVLLDIRELLIELKQKLKRDEE